MALDNITVEGADLKKVRPDIEQYYLEEDQTNFDDEIANQKRKVIREIRNHEQALRPGIATSTLNGYLEDITDSTDESIKDKIVHLTIAGIFRSNNQLALANEYQTLAENIELEYVIEDTETINNEPKRFGR